MRFLVTDVAGFHRLQRRTSVAHTCGDAVVRIDSIDGSYDPQLKRDRLAEIDEMGGDFNFEQVHFADHYSLNEALVEKAFDRIVHLGAQAGVRYWIENQGAYLDAILAGNLNILEVAKACGAEHVVDASSSSTYRGCETLLFLVEDRVDQPLSLYVATKKVDELMSETDEHHHSLPQTGLRFFTVYGLCGRPAIEMWLFSKAAQIWRSVKTVWAASLSVSMIL